MLASEKCEEETRDTHFLLQSDHIQTIEER